MKDEDREFIGVMGHGDTHAMMARCNRRRREQGLPLFDKAGNEIGDSKARVFQATEDYMATQRKKRSRSRAAR